MSTDIGLSYASKEIVLSNCIYTCASWCLIVNIFTLYLECEDFSCWIDIVVMCDNTFESLRALIKFANYHAVNYGTCHVGVSVWSHARLIFENISSIKEFTDIAANMEVDKKLPPWVLRSELPHI